MNPFPDHSIVSVNRQVAKTFIVNAVQVVAVRHENAENGLPCIQWFYIPEGLGTCSVTTICQDGGAGFGQRDKLFESLSQSDAEQIVELFGEVVQ